MIIVWILLGVVCLLVLGEWCYKTCKDWSQDMVDQTLHEMQQDWRVASSTMKEKEDENREID